jgi:hypothetical protein
MFQAIRAAFGSKVDQPVRFVLLGHQRCGSNLVTRLVGEHPEVRMTGEVLRPDVTAKTDGWAWSKLNLAAWDGHSRRAYADGEDGEKFLDRVVFGPPYVPGIRASGLKLFYDQARKDDAQQTAWDYLLANDICVLHVVRRNLFDALVSREVANRRNRWVQIVEHKDQVIPPVAAFHLDPEMCHSYFDRLSALRRWATEAFARHRMLTLDYDEDLCGDYDRMRAAIQSFLGLSDHTSVPGTLKQQTTPVPEQVSNYDELARHFRHTSYAEWFSQPHA